MRLYVPVRMRLTAGHLCGYVLADELDHLVHEAVTVGAPCTLLVVERLTVDDLPGLIQ